MSTEHTNRPGTYFPKLALLEIGRGGGDDLKST